MRKTVEVEALRTMANALLSAPSSFSTLETLEEQKAQRLGAAGLLEGALFIAGRYKGWSHLASEYLPAGDALRPNHDDTRRRYH